NLFNVANTFGCHASKQIEVFFRRGSDDTQRIKKQHQSCIRRRRSLAFIYTNIAASSPFVEVQLNLTPPQMAMFIKGLQYVIPCQSRFLHRTNEQIIQKQYEMLFNTVTNCLQDNCMSASNKHVQEAFSELKTTVHELHVKKLSGHLNIRARYEHALVKNIRRLIDKQPHVIVRRTDKSKVFYIGKTDDFLRKAAAYMTTTNAYEVFSDNKSPLHNSLTAVQTLLGALLQEKPGTPLRPIVASINAPTTNISKFLNDLLAPLFLKVTRETTFTNSIDLVRKLEKYAIDGHLMTTTNFITADVKDLYTMIPRIGALQALASFVEKYSKHGHIGNFFHRSSNANGSSHLG
ncbi:unnamed protein product, partial [Adineta ricciae]